MIRLATMQDLDAAAALYAHFHAQPAEKRTEVGWVSGVYPTRATAESALARGDLYVFEQDGAVLASAVINRLQVDVYAGAPWRYAAADDRVLVLHTLLVDPAAAGHGIGRQFVAYYEQLARAMGCTVLRMDTNANNRTARAFYAKLGFEQAAIVPCRFNGIEGVQLVLLEKRLQPA